MPHGRQKGETIGGPLALQSNRIKETVMAVYPIATGYLAALAGAWWALAPVTAQAQHFVQVQYMLQAVPCPPGQACAASAPRFGLRCRTVRLLCTLPRPGPVNSDCYCNTPAGPQPGKVVE
jgi:hypothetical protein